MQRRTDASRSLLALLLSIVFVWLVSNQEQRQQALSWLGIASATPVRASLDNNKPFVPRIAPELMTPAGLSTRSLSFASLVHGAIGNPCIEEGAANPTQASISRIYSWVDSQGRTNFSDVPPDDKQATVVGATADGGVSMFSADYKYLGKQPPVDFRAALERNVDGVFRMFSTELGLRSTEPLHVNITIIDGESRFARYRNQKAPGAATNSGYYSFAENEAVVRWAGSERTLAVARHEISHLALGNWLGVTPLWLNEGMAEVMEQLEFRQSYARAEAPLLRVQHLRELHRSEKLPSFRWLLHSERGDWDRLGDDIAYPYAWSLLYFLIQDTQHQRLVSDYLNTLADHRCKRFDHSAYLDRAYQGGLTSLEQDWKKWLTRDTPVALQF